MSRLELKAVSKTYPGGIVAARGVDITVEDGELFVIVGPSGSGKSTLLRVVAGLESLDDGSILLDGRRIDGLAPSDRDLAMVFQDQVLYPHLNVFENMAFGLRARRVARREVSKRVEETAAILGLADCLDRSPGTLSGGQRRRVSLGRALVLRPKLFLFDEPFSGLDAPLRASTRSELAELNRKFKATMVLVTHDQSEALALGDRIAVIDHGRVVQVGRPLELYDQPATRFVAGFLHLESRAEFPMGRHGITSRTHQRPAQQRRIFRSIRHDFPGENPSAGADGPRDDRLSRTRHLSPDRPALAQEFLSCRRSGAGRLPL